jgi:hypothetical protein
MFDSLLNELQSFVVTAAGAAVTALCIYLFSWLRTYLDIVESDSNEGEIRRAVLTEAGKLVVQGKIDDPNALLNATAKIAADLHWAVQEEEYDSSDIKDMIIGAAGLLKLLK